MKLKDLIIGDLVVLRNGDYGFVHHVHEEDKPFLVINRTGDEEKANPYIVKGFFNEDMEYTPNGEYSIVEVKRIGKDEFLSSIHSYSSVWNSDKSVAIDQLFEELEDINAEIEYHKKNAKKELKQMKKQRKKIIKKLKDIGN